MSKNRIQLTCGLLVASVLLALPALTVATGKTGTGSPPTDRMLTNGMTRAEFVNRYQELMAVQYQPPPCVAGQEMFDDVPASSPFCPWVEELSRRGITLGCDENNFCPHAPASRRQHAVFLIRSMEACPTLDPTDEMIRVGGVCIDKYEASIWDAPVGGNQIIADDVNDYCNPNGQDCDDIYARSVAGVEPAAFISYFQAQQALANSGKRLPTNGEWQMAAAGTPDSTACNVDAGVAQNTGANADCVSRWGAFDMVGNLWEIVDGWVNRSPLGTVCQWPDGFGDDFQGFCGSAGDGTPGILLRGGTFFGSAGGPAAGPFAVLGWASPTGPVGEDPGNNAIDVGFRGAR